MSLIYHSNGKFLLTGEYLVLKGALALATPLKFGQSMTIKTVSEPFLHWDAYKPDGPWFSVTLNQKNIEIIDCNDRQKAEKLVQILKAVRELNPDAFNDGLHFETHLDFDQNWGLGSSSTLISNLARWANIDPYELLKMTFGGSGYDIACATAEQSIYYQLVDAGAALRQAQGPKLNSDVKPEVVEPVETPTPLVKSVDFNPPFAEHLFFVYQGQKQSSSKEIKAFLAKANPDDLQKDIEAISEISRAVPKCQNLDEFGLLMQCHERIIARCIGQEPVQKRFPGFEGTLKSLGAWGGDFILAATEWDEKQVRDFFKGKGLETVFGYKEITLNE